MKITLEQQEKSKELHQELIQKARESLTFKEQLINNPKDTICELGGLDANAFGSVEIVVEDQTDSNKVYLNIPKKVNLDNIELSDEQMELVAGGIAVVTVSAAAIVGLGILFVGSVALGVALYNSATSE